MTITSRRAMLAGIIAPAIVTAASFAEAAAADVADAELLELGRQHQALTARLDAATEICKPLWKEFGERLKAWRKTIPGPATDEMYVAEIDRINRDVGLAAIEERGEHPDHLSDQMDPIVRRILAIQPTTLAGLAVKARVARYGSRHLWDKPDGRADWDHLLVRNAIDAIISMADRA
jgi:hypothetical protein